MTTPAVSINQTVTDSGTLQLVYSSGSSTTSTYSSPVVKRTYIQRPASVNNPIFKNWRRPWNYFRTVRRQASNPSTVIQTYGESPPIIGAHLVREIWNRDSFWQTNSFPFASVSHPSYLEDLALIAALNKVKGNNVNIGVALAEAKQTAALLMGGARDIAKQVRNYQRHHPRDWESVKRFQRGAVGHQAWKKIPARWLELQYGWKPLMSDINGACNALESTWNKNYPLIGVQASAFATDSFRRTGGGQYGSSRVEKNDFVFQTKVGLYFSLTNPWLAQFNALGLINPFLIAWEKVPYSFVVDWFLPIGGWLSALDADFGFSFKGGYVTDISRGRGFIESEVPKPRASGWSVTSTGGRVDSTYFAMNRRRYTSVPIPGLHFKNPISPGHIANAMALLTQAFRH